jgi:hypothetical protein
VAVGAAVVVDALVFLAAAVGVAAAVTVAVVTALVRARLAVSVLCADIGVRPRRLPFEQNPEERGQPLVFVGCPRCRIECSGVAIL